MCRTESLRTAAVRAASAIRFTKDVNNKDEDLFDKLDLPTQTKISEQFANHDQWKADHRPIEMQPRKIWKLMSPKDRQNVLGLHNRVAGMEKADADLVTDLSVGQGVSNAVVRTTFFTSTNFIEVLLTSFKGKTVLQKENNENFKYLMEFLDDAPGVFEMNKELKLVDLKRPRTNSKGALEPNPAISSFDLNKNKMKADDIYYTMFNKTFYRFKLPTRASDLFPPDVAKVVDEIVKQHLDAFDGFDLKAAGNKISEPQEPTTQLMFQLNLRLVLKSLYKKGLITPQCVRPVQGMKPIKYEDTISDTYWDLYKAEKTLNKSAKKKKLISVCSDLAVTGGHYDELGLDDKLDAMAQRQIFLESPLHIEMKRSTWLGSSTNKKGKLNRSPLTQLCTEASARKAGRAAAGLDAEKEAFSILTDGRTLYILRHDVKKDIFWVSRSLIEGKDFILALCWLLITTTGRSTERKTTEFQCEDWEDGVEDNQQDYSQGDMDDTEVDHYQSNIWKYKTDEFLKDQEEVNRLAYAFSDYLGRLDHAAVDKDLRVQRERPVTVPVCPPIQLTVPLGLRQDKHQST